MSNIVKEAFKNFLRDFVNLDPEIVNKARKSRDNLLENISEFDTEKVFFKLCPKYNIQFGSFARGTKCRELDDIDLMIGINAQGATYSNLGGWDNIKIYPGYSNAQTKCKSDDDSLNSVKVLNLFKKQLEKVREYRCSEVHRNQEAVVLNLISKDWSFDIVPCFHTTKEKDGRSYYLIPNGSGNWKKTDPSIDRNYIKRVNHNNYKTLLQTIRLLKKWNKIKHVKKIPSYLLETMIANMIDKFGSTDDIALQFVNCLIYIRTYIRLPVTDVKDIQGNINELSNDEKIKISERARTDYEKALEAVEEKDKKQYYTAIKKWKEIFGEEFAHGF